jgi:hypothetical protein
MVRKYIQSTLEEKLSTSDFGAAVKKQLCLAGGPFRSHRFVQLYIDYLTYEYWGWWLFWDWRRTSIWLVLLLRFALLSKLVGLASVVCVSVSTVHRRSR